MEKAEFIRSSVEQLELHTASTTLKITASFGISDKSGCQSLDQMLQKSDKMLYSAKRSGKNRVRSRLNNP
jgi:diguanylate cyclase (GGDEF)-like protein